MVVELQRSVARIRAGEDTSRSDDGEIQQRIVDLLAVS